MDQAILCQSLNYSRIVVDVYICQTRSFHVTRQNSSYLANTLAYTNDLLVSNFYHLANTITNTNDKADDFTREDDNLIPWQIDNADRYGIDDRWGKLKGW